MKLAGWRAALLALLLSVGAGGPAAAQSDDYEYEDAVAEDALPATRCISMVPAVAAGSNGIFRDACDEAVSIVYCAKRTAKE